jgi:hypothetical protein
MKLVGSQKHWYLSKQQGDWEVTVPELIYYTAQWCKACAVVYHKLGGGVWRNDDHDDTNNDKFHHIYKGMQ